jgi:putative transposase
LGVFWGLGRPHHPPTPDTRNLNMRYRRANAAGGTYFFTVNLNDRTSRLLVEQIDALRASVRTVRARWPFEIVAWVVLPDHLHAIWTLPVGDADFSTRWMLIKSGFSRRIARGESISSSRAEKGERGIWQRRYWEHQIRDEDDLQRHADYVHINPVKHGYVGRAADWPWSSIHREIRAGILRPDWAADPFQQRRSGERGE